jgi:hypothetical protein
MKRLVFFAVMLVLMGGLASATLGLNPAKKMYDYKEELRDEVTYRVISDHSERTIELSVEGDLAEYITLSQNTTQGSGGFSVSLVLPPGLVLLGPQETYIVASESIGSQGAVLGARTIVKALLVVEAPFPGEYVEVDLKVDHVNEGADIPVSLQVWNRGTDGVNVQPRVLFSDASGRQVDQVLFPLTSMVSQEKQHFVEAVSTQGWQPGVYLAEALASYGTEVASHNRTVIVGTLFVNVTNSTSSLSQDGIQRFLIGVESHWNDPLNGVYAEVNLTQNGEEAAVFKTPSVSLDGRGQRELAGFVDTDELSGDYVANIAVYYGKTKTIVARPLSVGGGSSWMWIILAVLVLGLGAFLVKRLKKR